ncbi:hypothetical protein T265_01706 [Opisthorchis viverrini]|uniref:Uncharacterized protein n=1 Tax=Opisthorchis viverrini TaxID=6198 RepID=A0A075A216_OPIVI|nr:hypothetical protein T265_01706 [Opisthorchis viverrini]KER32287.1 hypothetical protein T265_01706 [Opisthorchis viverrini]
MASKQITIETDEFGGVEWGLRQLRKILAPVSIPSKEWIGTPVIPYKAGRSEVIRRLLNLANIQVAFQKGKTLRSVLVQLKGLGTVCIKLTATIALRFISDKLPGNCTPELMSIKEGLTNHQGMQNTKRWSKTQRWRYMPQTRGRHTIDLENVEVLKGGCDSQHSGC